MNVMLNGEAAELATEATVADAVAAAGLDDAAARGVAVAVEGEVVPRGEWHGRRLREGESVEVVRAVQGG
jgi:sulfur carrier protein